MRPTKRDVLTGFLAACAAWSTGISKTGAQSQVRRYFSDKFVGPITVTPNGKVLAGTTVAAPPRGCKYNESLSVETRGASGHHTIWVSSERVSPFQVSNGTDSGNNYNPAIRDGNLYWKNTETGLRSEKLYYTFQTLSPKVRKIILLVATGQSTAIGSFNRKALTTRPPAPGHVLMWNGGIRILGHDHGPERRDEPLPDDNALYITDAFETVAGVTGETQWTQAAYELQKRLGEDVAVVAATVAIGSAPYIWIAKGTQPYLNLIEVVKRTYLASKLRGLDFDVVVGWPDQPGDKKDSESDFLAKAIRFQTDLTEDINMAINRTGEVMLFVDGWSGDTVYKSDTAEQPLAQLQWGVSQKGKGAYSSPTYLFKTETDGVHRSAEGAALDGAFLGRVIAHALLGYDTKPLYVTSAVMASATEISCQVHLPPGAKTLSDHSALVTSPPRLGITCHDPSTDAELAIDQVIVTGADTFSVRLASSPKSPSVRLEIAFRGNSGANSGPQTGDRSPLNDGNPDTSFYGVSMANHIAPQRIEVKVV